MSSVNKSSVYTVADTVTFLASVSDWADWNRAFVVKAGKQLWAKINPETASKPGNGWVDQPTPFVSTNALPLNDLGKAYVRQSFPVDHIPDPLNDEPIIVRAYHLSPEGLGLGKLGMANAESDRRAWRYEQEKVAKLKDWVLKTVSQHIKRTCLKPGATLTEWYANLKRSYGKSDSTVTIE